MYFEKGFRLQRRNFLIISTLLWFYYYAQATVKKIALGGVYIEFERKDALPDLLWLIWIYMLVRYIQYFSVYGLPQYKLVYYETLKSIKGPEILGIKKFAYSLLPDSDFIKQSTFRLAINKRRRTFSILCLKVWRNISKRKEADGGLNFIRGRKLLFRRLVLAPWYFCKFLASSFLEITLEIYPPDGPYISRGLYKQSTNLKPEEAVLLWLKLNYIVVVKHAAFLEFILPLMIGLSPLVYLFY